MQAASSLVTEHHTEPDVIKVSTALDPCSPQIRPMAAAGNHTGMAQEKGKVVAELAASLQHAAQSLQEPAFPSRDLTLFPKEQQQLEIRAKDSLQQCSEEVLFGNMVEVCNPTLGARLMPKHTQLLLKHRSVSDNCCNKTQNSHTPIPGHYSNL